MRRLLLPGARLALRLSEARGRELEHQIDTLNQQLAEVPNVRFVRRVSDMRPYAIDGSCRASQGVLMPIFSVLVSPSAPQ